MKTNRLLRIHNESYGSYTQNSNGVDNRLLDYAIENYEAAATDQIDDIETVEELGENIEEQKELLESGQEVTIDDVVEAEAKLESYTSLLAGASRQQVFGNYGSESYSNPSNYRSMLQQNLANKEKLYNMALEALSKHATSFGDFFKDLLKTAKSEGDDYRKRLLKIKESLGSVGNNKLTNDVVLTPMLVEILTSDLLYQAALNFRLFSEGKFTEAKNFQGYCKWANGFEVVHDDEVQASELIPMAIADKGSMITTASHGKNIHTIIADIQELKRSHSNDTTEDLYILASHPEEEKFRKMPIIIAQAGNESQLMASKNGIRTTQDCVKAIDKLIALNDKCLPVIEKGIGVLGIGKWTPGMRTNFPIAGPNGGPNLININIWARGLIKNNINKMILRIPRILYKCGKELEEIIRQNG